MGTGEFDWVRYFTKEGKGIWSDRDDLRDQIAFSDVLCVLQPPDVVPKRRGHVYRFTDLN